MTVKVQSAEMASAEEIPLDISRQEASTATLADENFWIQLMTLVGWYPRNMSGEEKRLILKLDLSILIFGCLSFFTKYLDQQSITNAYVSGMKEELGLYGNELNYLSITFWASYCVFMIPGCYYITHLPINTVFPILELGWAFSTFGLAWAPNVQTLYAMRFFTGLFECCSFTGTIFVIGSWYKPNEIGRRVAFFFIASPLGTMFAGYLQAAAYTNLNHVHGLSGWRWLFIIDAIITIPIAFLGFFVFPDVPSRKKPAVLTAGEFELARKRIAGFTSPPQLEFSQDILRRVFGRWHWYLFVFQWILMDQSFAPSGQPFSLYLKAYPEVYSIVQINTLPTIATAVSVVAAIACGFLADRTGKFWLLTILVNLPVLTGMALLVSWDIGFTGRLIGFILTGFSGPMSPVTMSWATMVMANDAEERAVVTASMNAIGQAIAAGVQAVQYPATGAPNFRGGFISVLVTSAIQIVNTLAILGLSAGDRRRDLEKATTAIDTVLATENDSLGEKV